MNALLKGTLSSSHLLQTEDEGLGAQNLVRLPGFTQSLLDDVTIVIIILRQRHKTFSLVRGFSPQAAL